MEIANFENFSDFTEYYPVLVDMDLSHEAFFELRLDATQVKLATQEVTVKQFDEHARPALPKAQLELHVECDPEFREMEDLENKPNKVAIEGEDDTLIDLTVQWLNMFNEAQKKIIAKRITKEEEEEEYIPLPKDDVITLAMKKEEKEEKERHFPAPEHINQHLKKQEEAEEKHGSSAAAEAPSSSSVQAVPRKSSYNKQQEQKPEPKMLYDVDISECEEDSVLRQLKDCECGVMILDSQIVGRVAATRVSQLSEKSLANLKPKVAVTAIHVDERQEPETETNSEDCHSRSLEKIHL
eukprot:s702_g26.t1